MNGNIFTSRGLSDKEFSEIAKPLLLKVCNSATPDPFGTPFTNIGMKRFLLFEFWVPEGEFTEALKQICVNHGEESFFLSVPKPITSDPPQLYSNWEISVDDIGKLEKYIYPYMYTIFSKKGHWALVSSIELHALMTCTAAIEENLAHLVPGIRSQVMDFLESYNPKNWSSHPPDTSWIPDLLSHLYGKEKSIELLAMSDFKN